MLNIAAKINQRPVFILFFSDLSFFLFFSGGRSAEPRLPEGGDGTAPHPVPARVQEQVRHPHGPLHQLPQRSAGGVGRRGRRLKGGCFRPGGGRRVGGVYSCHTWSWLYDLKIPSHPCNAGTEQHVGLLFFFCGDLTTNE